MRLGIVMIWIKMSAVVDDGNCWESFSCSNLPEIIFGRNSWKRQIFRMIETTSSLTIHMELYVLQIWLIYKVTQQTSVKNFPVRYSHAKSYSFQSHWWKVSFSSAIRDLNSHDLPTIDQNIIITFRHCAAFTHSSASVLPTSSTGDCPLLWPLFCVQEINWMDSHEERQRQCSCHCCWWSPRSVGCSVSLWLHSYVEISERICCSSTPIWVRTFLCLSMTHFEKPKAIFAK